MKRRTFITSTAAAAAGSALAGCGTDEAEGPGVQTRPSVRWRIVSSYPRSLDTLYGVSEGIGRRVEALTDGRFQIRAYPAGELVPGTQVLGAVQTGTVEMGHTAGYYYVGSNPALAFDTCVPFGLTARQQTAWMRHGGGLELMREIYADFGVINFLGGNTGAQMGGWFRRPVGSLSELRGLKMRIPGLGGEVMSELGVTVQLMAGGEIYQALERGAIDATEWVGPYDDVKLGFHEIASHYYYPGWWEPGPNVSLLVNRQAWDRLPAAYQNALEAAAADVSMHMLAQYDARNQQALQDVLDAGVELVEFPQDMMQEARRISTNLLEQNAAGDATYRRVYDSFLRFREDAFRWFGTAEHDYARFAFPRMSSIS
ncbi:MAG: TRAP transporter substrate-binding protein [Rhodothermales bacterium]